MTDLQRLEPADVQEGGASHRSSTPRGAGNARRACRPGHAGPVPGAARRGPSLPGSASSPTTAPASALAETPARGLPALDRPGRRRGFETGAAAGTAKTSVLRRGSGASSMPRRSARARAEMPAWRTPRPRHRGAAAARRGYNLPRPRRPLPATTARPRPGAQHAGRDPAWFALVAAAEAPSCNGRGSGIRPLMGGRGRHGTCATSLGADGSAAPCCRRSAWPSCPDSWMRRSRRRQYGPVARCARPGRRTAFRASSSGACWRPACNRPT